MALNVFDIVPLKKKAKNDVGHNIFATKKLIEKGIIKNKIY